MNLGSRVNARLHRLFLQQRLYAWLERTLEQLPSYPVNRVHELLPLAR
jgi:transposase